MQSTLSVVLPALNEEGSIASIIERTLAGRREIRARANLAAVQVVEVIDGSSDPTAEIARGYRDVTTIAYARNRGYGAAVGSRLGLDGHMPVVRRFGNRMYSKVLRLWRAHGVTDTGSGIRVIRRSALERIYPLPDGMAFTPAMSSIALFDPRLTIVEVPMRYAERTGESKLHVLQDGVRFLRIIVDTALSYRPFRFFGTSGLALLGVALGFAARPVVYYLGARRIDDWMFYRLSAVAVAFVAGMHLVVIGLLAQQAVSIVHEDFEPPSRVRQILERLLRERPQFWGAFHCSPVSR